MSAKLRIVVADDDAVVRGLLQHGLSALGHDVVAVDGGRPLVAACAAAPPDVVVSDVQMPDLDGISAAEAIRRDGRTPVVLLSGGWDASARARAAGIAAVWCLNKPFRMPELALAIAAAAGPGGRAHPAPDPAPAAAVIPDGLLELAPTDLPIFRSVRYTGGGLGVPMDHLAPDDRALVRAVYEAVLRVAAARPNSADPLPSAEFVAAVRAVGDAGFVRAAQRLGTVTVRAGAGPLVRKVLHDIRGGGLTALVATAELEALGLPDPDLLATCGRLARDHCKIVRNALPDLDPPRRHHDEQLNYHGIETFVGTWDGATIREYGRDVAVAVACTYRGGVTASCLESGAVDRVLYNHLNNAARFAADGRVGLSIFPVGDGRAVRWVVSNAVAVEQRAWLEALAGFDLSALYAGGLTSGGSGVGLATCREFVAAAFGLPTPTAAVAGGYLGARLVGDEYRAWFHWPAYTP